MKKLLKMSLVMSLPLMVLFTSCGNNGEEETATIDQDAYFEAFETLMDNTASNDVSYTVVLRNNDKNITLNNSGHITKNADEGYTYVYSYQYLNEIGSEAESLISTESGTITATSDTITSEELDLSGSDYVFGINIKEGIYTHTAEVNEENVTLSGNISSRYFTKISSSISTTTKFYYTLTANKEMTKIESMELSYSTFSFDSIVVNVIYN